MPRSKQDLLHAILLPVEHGLGRPLGLDSVEAELERVLHAKQSSAIAGIISSWTAEELRLALEAIRDRRKAAADALAAEAQALGAYSVTITPVPSSSLSVAKPSQRKRSKR
jgi:hypothetical protein